MLKIKLIGTILGTLLLAVVATQAGLVNAQANSNSKKPVTAPITGADCKPGWGFGDKNHCHSGPSGLNR